MYSFEINFNDNVIQCCLGGMYSWFSILSWLSLNYLWWYTGTSFLWELITKTYKIFLSFRTFLQFSTSHNLMVHSRLYPDRYTSKNCTSYAEHPPPLQSNFSFTLQMTKTNKATILKKIINSLLLITNY